MQDKDGSTAGTAPTATVNPLDSTTTANLTLSNNLGAYDIKTTATYNTSGYATDPTKGIKLTFSVSTVNDHVPSLSPFVILKGATDQLTDLIRLVRSFNLQRGMRIASMPGCRMLKMLSPRRGLEIGPAHVIRRRHSSMRGRPNQAGRSASLKLIN